MQAEIVALQQRLQEMLRQQTALEEENAALKQALAGVAAPATPDAEQTIAFLTSVLMQLPVGVFVKDAVNRQILLCNPASELLFRSPRRQMLGQTANGLFPPAQAEFIYRTDSEVVREKKRLEVAKITLDNPEKGQRVWHVNKAPIENTAGKVDYILYLGEDITDQQVAMEALRESEERFPRRLCHLRRRHRRW